MSKPKNCCLLNLHFTDKKQKVKEKPTKPLEQGGSNSENTIVKYTFTFMENK